MRVRFGHFKSNKGIAFFESLLSLLPLLLVLLSQFQERFEVFPFDCKMEIYGRQNCGGLVFVVGKIDSFELWIFVVLGRENERTKHRAREEIAPCIPYY